MIKFLDGDAINAKIIETIKQADEYLLLISPFIKLTERIKSEINYLVSNKPDVIIEVVFGKNSDNPIKSLNANDLGFLKSLPNISISYVQDLHAKIYCSEDRLMLTSMNLHEFSQANNYEAAFVIEDGKFMSGLLNNSSNQAWKDALEFVDKIISKSTLVFSRGDVYKSRFFGFLEEVVGSEKEDNSADFFKKSKPKVFNNTNNGHCIRTGVTIPFNIKKPYSDVAFKSWQRFANEDYKEKYCHFSGEKCDGETSLKQPILKKNWRDAKVKFGF